MDLSKFGRIPPGPWSRCGAADSTKGGDKGSLFKGEAAPDQAAGTKKKSRGEASTPGRGSEKLRVGSHGTAPQGPLRAHMASGPPTGDCQVWGGAGQERPPHLGPVSITGSRAGGARTSHVLTSPRPRPARGGNALSHSYERSSLLEGGRQRHSHTIPRLSATRAGAGRWVPEAQGLQQSPPTREPAPGHTSIPGTPSRERSLGLNPPSRCQGHTWWRVSLPSLGNPCAPGWFWNQLP